MANAVSTIAVAHVDVLCPKCSTKMERTTFSPLHLVAADNKMFCPNPDCELYDKNFRLKTPVGQVELEEC